MGEYAYIDGAYLRERVKEFSKRFFAEGVLAEINYERLFSRFEKKFYYTAYRHGKRTKKKESTSSVLILCNNSSIS